jgi:hypothetical protein
MFLINNLTWTTIQFPFSSMRFRALLVGHTFQTCRLRLADEIYYYYEGYLNLQNLASILFTSIQHDKRAM